MEVSLHSTDSSTRNTMSNRIKVTRSSKDIRSISTFFLTINTNQPKENNPDDDKLQRDIEKLARRFTEVLKVVFDGPPMDGTEDIEVSYDTEYGTGSAKRLHAHVAIQVKHNTKIQIDVNKLQSWGKKRGYVCHGKYVKGQFPVMEIMKRYAAKTYPKD